jgi:hypothetical protein
LEQSAKTDKRCKIITALLALVSLFAGGMIYLLFRPTSLSVFEWIKHTGIMDFVEMLRFGICTVPAWIEYTLPDGLWMFSYCLIIGCIWDFNFKKCGLLLFLLLFLSVLFEVLQHVHFLSGTFDRMDVIAYFLAFSLGAIYILITKKYIKTKT